MWSFVRVQTILCSILCYAVKWFDSRSFTKEQKNTCAIWSEERTTKRNKLRYNNNDSSSNNENKSSCACWITNSSGLCSVFLWLNKSTFLRKFAIRAVSPLRAVCASFPRVATAGIRLRHAIDHVGEFHKCAVTQNWVENLESVKY